ncbi:hypothetical protein BHE74_00021114 [Ensete ventricosum]|uniref:Uncharacterized protein n=1 Tax=Ensete ventricosum TaxID=4639 RepID=A0A445M8R7_ENSVE|nr:hypothetical protein BHE74_00021114 [Ensete ventricosum]RZR70627.1 hypothetical protein BHM03_00000886 [Ensete ventricosum]
MLHCPLIEKVKYCSRPRAHHLTVASHMKGCIDSCTHICLYKSHLQDAKGPFLSIPLPPASVSIVFRSLWHPSTIRPRVGRLSSTAYPLIVLLPPRKRASSYYLIVRSGFKVDEVSRREGEQQALGQDDVTPLVHEGPL